MVKRATRSKTDCIKFQSSDKLDCDDDGKLSTDILILRTDYFLVRLLVLFAVTVCFTIFVIQYNTSVRTYEMLQQLTEHRLPHFLPEEDDFDIWDWDPHRLMLTVNTSLYVH